MGLSALPELPEPAERKEWVRLLLEVVAMEELSPAALISAEAEKAQSVRERGIAGPILAEEAIELNGFIHAIIEAAARKEERRMKKSKILTLFEKKDDMYSKAYQMDDD